MFLLVYARALLNSGEMETAISLFNKTVLGAIPVNNKYYVRLRYYLIRLEFLILENQKTEALDIIREMKTISKFIGHQFFYERALFFEHKVNML